MKMRRLKKRLKKKGPQRMNIGLYWWLKAKNALDRASSYTWRQFKTESAWAKKNNWP